MRFFACRLPLCVFLRFFFCRVPVFKEKRVPGKRTILGLKKRNFFHDKKKKKKSSRPPRVRRHQNKK